MSRKAPAGKNPMLETERLVLRPVSADEEDSLHRISNEPDVRLPLWDNEPVSEATVKDLIAQSDRMLSQRYSQRLSPLVECGWRRRLQDHRST